MVDFLPALRVVGGVALIVLGLSLAGILRIPALERTWRPLDAGAAGSLATTTGSIALVAPASAGQASVGDRLGGRLVGTHGGWLASFGLGAIFAIGWTPCIGIILGGILTHGRHVGHGRPGHDPADRLLPRSRRAVRGHRARATTGRPACSRPLLRHGRTVSLIGGLLVSAIGVAMVLDLLRLLPRYFQFQTAI